jgi:hypothetical protein
MCHDVSANKSLYGNERETPSTRSRFAELDRSHPPGLLAEVPPGTGLGWGESRVGLGGICCSFSYS